MPKYVDGWLVPVPRGQLDEYRRIARRSGKVWREHGALEYVECVAEDTETGEMLSFPRAMKLKRNETVIFGYVVYRSRAHRDRVNKKAMADPRLADLTTPDGVPFDTKRLVYGGFSTVVALKD